MISAAEGSAPAATDARSDSATLQAKIVGFDVSRKKLRAATFSSGVRLGGDGWLTRIQMGQ